MLGILSGVGMMKIHHFNDEAPTVSQIKDYKGLPDIKTLDWPGNSPDLNPIENLWTLLKDEVHVSASGQG